MSYRIENTETGQVYGPYDSAYEALEALTSMNFDLTGPPEGIFTILNEEDSFVEDDGQPSMYEEYQDLYGGDDWDHGQYDY